MLRRWTIEQWSGFIFILWIVGVAVGLILMGLLTYAIFHFIFKFW